MAENLWGDLPGPDSLRTPSTMLKEQAAQLASLTDNVLEGRLRQEHMSGGKTMIHFYIAVPILDNYQYQVLTILHDPIVIYPMQITDETLGKKYPAEDEDSFKTIVTTILQNPELRRVIAAIRRQAAEH